tara:strand:+ start:146 stop:349 length:204 start_codon:yes stop_codon:yes gene_type:complete
MALSKKEKSKMSDAMMVGGTIRAASEIYKVVKPVVKKAIKGVKSSIKKRKKRKNARKYNNNTYEEGK